MDFDITHYVKPEKIVPYEDKDDSWKEQFYGDFESKPETEQQLLILQDNYLRTRDSEVWNEMYEICQKYMRSLLLKQLKNGKFMDPEEVEDKTTQATLSFMSQYKRRPDFEVGASFAGMMRFKVLEVLGKKPQDYSVSLNFNVNEEGTELVEILDSDKIKSTSNFDTRPDKFLDTVSINDIITDVLSQFDEAINYDPSLEVLARLYLTLYLRKPRSRHAKRVFLDRWAPDFRTEQVLERVVLEVYKSLKQGTASI